MDLKKVCKSSSLIIITTLLIGCRSELSYKEGEVYSEKVLNGYKDYEDERSLSEFTTREKAVEIAENIFKECFQDEFNKEELRESVNLINKKIGEFNWGITWSKISKDQIIKDYYILIDSRTGKVLNASVYIDGEMYNEDSSIENIEVDENTIDLFIDIATPLINELKIDITKYKVDGCYENNKGKLILKSGEEAYEFVINIDSKKLIAFNSYGGASKNEYIDSGR